MEEIRLPEIDLERVSEEIGDFVVGIVTHMGSTGCVIGLSGGIDSTTSAALIKRAFDNYNATGPDETLELVGYILPSKTNGSADTEDGVGVARRLGIRYEIQSIEPVIEAFTSTNPEALEDWFHRGNLSSRVRSNILSTKAATENKTVAGTGNRDEDYGIGYYTLFGDGAVHISPIGNLSKRLVRQMASYLGFEDLAERVPSAGLEPGQTDFKDLGYKYDVVELVTEGIDQGFTPAELASHDQVTSVLSTQFAEYHATHGTVKHVSAAEVVADIQDRHATAKEKVKIVSPPVAPITLDYGVR